MAWIVEYRINVFDDDDFIVGTKVCIAYPVAKDIMDAIVKLQGTYAKV